MYIAEINNLNFTTTQLKHYIINALRSTFFCIYKGCLHFDIYLTILKYCSSLRDYIPNHIN